MSLRDSYRQTATAEEIAKKKEEEAAALPAKQSGGFLKIEEGDNFFRFYPAHPKDRAYNEILIMRRKLPTFKKDSTGKDIIHSIFDAKTHGGFAKDPCELYVEIARKKLEEKYANYELTEEEVSKHKDLRGFLYSKILPLTNYVSGINTNASYARYAEKYAKPVISAKKEFGLVELYTNQREEVEKAASALVDVEDTIGFDPFSDIDKGWMVNVKVTKQSEIVDGKTKNKTIYAIAHRVVAPISDEDLEKFEKVKTLRERYRNNYSRKDFDKTIEGLTAIEKKYRFGVLNEPEFVALIEKIDTTLPEDNGQAQQKEGDKFDKMNRQQLEKHVAENGLSLMITKSTTDNEIRDAIRNYSEDENDLPAKKPASKKQEVDENELIKPQKGDLPWDDEDESKKKVKKDIVEEQQEESDDDDEDVASTVRSKYSKK